MEERKPVGESQLTVYICPVVNKYIDRYTSTSSPDERWASDQKKMEDLAELAAAAKEMEASQGAAADALIAQETPMQPEY